MSWPNYFIVIVIRRKGKFMGKYFSVWVCSALISSIILMCFVPNVSAYPEINRSCAYTFYDATGGDDSDWTLFSDEV